MAQDLQEVQRYENVFIYLSQISANSSGDE